MIGLIVGFVAHRIAKLSDEHDHAYVIRWSAIAAVCGLGFNCFFEPALKYVWYTLLFPNADKAASAIKALIAINVHHDHQRGDQLRDRSRPLCGASPGVKTSWFFSCSVGLHTCCADRKKEYKNLIDAVDLGWILKLRKINSAV